MPVAPQRDAPGGAHAPSAEIAILWLTAGLSCDGDTIAMTAATQPSIEDLLSGAIPGLPR
jgi:hydrogenase small subunit